MKVLGRGWQYTTYDLGNGRVLKRYNSVLTAYGVMFDSFLRYGGPKPWHFARSHRQCKAEAAASLAVIAAGTLEPWMIGNAVLLGDLSYEQDKLRPLQGILQAAHTQEATAIIDDFVRLNLELVKRNVIDKSFKIGVNFALDAAGRVVLMDLGELYTDDALERQRQKRVWDSPYIHRTITDPTARAYYVAQMDAHFGHSAANV